jgi:hypothetical protein
MREHVLLFCLLGLVLTATIILVAAPGAVTWALALIEYAPYPGVPNCPAAEDGRPSNEDPQISNWDPQLGLSFVYRN